MSEELALNVVADKIEECDDGIRPNTLKKVTICLNLCENKSNSSMKREVDGMRLARCRRESVSTTNQIIYVDPCLCCR